MRHTLACFVTLALVVFPLTSSASSPDLCDDVFRDATGAPIVDSTGMGLSKFCSWTNELDVAAWGDDVCCTFTTGSPSSANCTLTDSVGRCATGFKFYCDYAVQGTGNAVTCQQAWPDACAESLCSEMPIGATPLEDTEPLCCTDVDVCTVVDINAPPSCAGKYVMCESPFSNEDGSVGCADDE